MSIMKLIVTAVTMAVVISGLAAEVHAAGGGEACVVTTFADIKNAAKIKGSAAVTITNWAGPTGLNPAQSVAATLTLTSKNTTAIFQATNSTPGPIVSAEDVMCNIINLDPLSTSGDIFQVFGIPQKPGPPSNTLKLCLITNASSNNPSGQPVLCQSIGSLDLNQIPGTLNWTAIIDKLTIYVLP
jgi:hypothetical protein